MPPVVWVAGLSVVVGCYETAWQQGILPSFLPSFTSTDLEVPGLASFALSLLLAYRTSSSYRRWEEARMLWGMLLNRSRDLFRQVKPHACHFHCSNGTVVSHFCSQSRRQTTSGAMDRRFELQSHVDAPN